MIMSKMNGLRINTNFKDSSMATGEAEVNLLSPTTHKLVNLHENVGNSRNTTLPNKNRSTLDKE